MFNFMKNKKKKPVDDTIQTILTNYQVHEQSLTHFITAIQQTGNRLTLDLQLPDSIDPEKIHRELSQKLHLYGIQEINMNVKIVAIPKQETAKHLPKTTNAMPTEQPIKKAPTQAELSPHPRIQHILVVASGKGGVGKSTTTVNLALALQKLGKKVGVLDADIYGPSIPTMLGVAGKQPILENEQFVPINAYGMPMLSIGSLLTDENTPIAWRGAKATGALMQLYHQTNWPNLDYLVIDMPPGTGDIQLTLAQRIPVTAAVIVTTPQHIALLDAQKGIEMFHKTQIPVIGIIENMALHTCSNCGHTETIFGAGGGKTMAENYQVPLLGQLPLAIDIRQQVDKGEPSVLVGDKFAEYYLKIANNIEHNIQKFTKSHHNNRFF